MKNALMWVSLPHATFGLVVRAGVVTEAAPIARWTIGEPASRIWRYFRRQGALLKTMDYLGSLP